MPQPFPLLLALCASATSACTAAASEPPRATSSTDKFMKGMTVSCPGYGQIWGTSAMKAALDDLSGLGVEWVAIHPYAAIRRDASVRFRPAMETGYLERAVEITRDAGQKLFLKPHLAYWGSFEWRGTIDFGDDQEAWRRFFAEYRAFILDQARFAERFQIPLFAVGVEYERTVRFEKEWREIIAAVRAVYSGRITYAANWDGIERVPFWDAVDLIGVQAYFPLSPGSTPKRSELEAAWVAHLAQLEALSKRVDRPVVFAEIGYARALEAASKPWADDNDASEAAIALRSELLEVAFTRVPKSPFVRGMFWWKWIPGPGLFDRDFSMKDPEARTALKRHWAPR